MRETLFRGKRKDNNEWSYGYLIADTRGRMYITLIESHCDGIFPETVCEYTGITDKNGKKIFEGDIVRYLFGYNFTQLEKIGVVKYADGAYSIISDLENKDFEVIGNIYDNPDLLKGVRENENK